MSPLEKKEIAEEIMPQQEAAHTKHKELLCVQDAGEKPPLHTINSPERNALKTLLAQQEAPQEIEMEGAETEEKNYVRVHQQWNGLEQRYADSRTDATYVREKIQAFASTRGLSPETSETAHGTFSRETLRAIQKMVQKDIDCFLRNKECGCHNPEKHRIVSEQTERYLTLLAQAQEEGDVAADLTAEDVLRLARENVRTLCYQDRVASENLLGDHGIRHLVQHNITMTEKMFDELSRHGQEVKAIDRLIAHQVMIDHDIGYAMDPVRAQINTGDFSADKGHNVLSAKFARQRASAAENPFAKVFSEEHQRTIHQGILEHDSSTVAFRLHDTSTEGRRQNVFSAIHAADNSHAFEDKLPELLYTHPTTLKYMRLMKSAGEIGDQELLENLKIRLVKEITEHEGYSEDDKEALVHTVKSLTKKSYAFSVGRICGSKPELTIDGQGTLHILVQESAIHRETVGLFGQAELDQLRKFVADFTGKKKEEVNLNVAEITGAGIRISIKGKVDGDVPEKTDYQRRVEELIRERSFRDYHERDTTLTARQKILETGDKELAKTLLPHNASEAAIEQHIAATLASIREERRNLLNTYLGT